MSAQPINMLDPNCEKGQEKIVRVTLGDGGYPRVEPDHVVIDRNLDERVVWRAEDGISFTICFGDETPFESFHFHPCLPASGSVRKGASGGEYKYSVEVNGKVIDPRVTVHPPS